MIKILSDDMLYIKNEDFTPLILIKWLESTPTMYRRVTQMPQNIISFPTSYKITLQSSTGQFNLRMYNILKQYSILG